MGECLGGYGVMGVYGGPKVSSNGLVLSLDAANQKLKRNALFYKWFTTDGTNPTTKAGFDAFFAVSPQSSGIDEAREINWLVVADRPSYITQTTSFAWEVTGFLIITEPGEYIFNTRSDDGNELQINGQVLTSFYGGRGVPNPGDVSSPITLGVGAHPFQYRMQQGGGGAGAQVRWQRPSSSTYEVIPSSNFAVGIDNNVFPDLVGNNNGVLINGVGYNSDNGGSLVFDGVDDYVNFTDKNEFTFTNARFSLEVFFRYVNKTDTDNTIFGKRDYGATQREYNFYVYEPSSTPTLRFIISSNLTANWTTVETPAIQKNVWYHAIATSDSGVGRIYLNGSLSATNSSMNSSTTNGTSPLSVGCAFNSGSPLQYFNGSIPLVRLYNRALTASEIQQNFIATRSRFGI
jgi:hypothetical protein